MRLFVAIEVPDRITRKVAELSSDLRSLAVREIPAGISLTSKELPAEAIKEVKPKNMHLTLRFLGAVANNELKRIEECLHEVRFEKFQVKVSGIGVFPGTDYVKVAWAGCESEALKVLAEKVGEALRSIGKEEEREFSPHLTIARVRRKIDVKQFLEKHKNDEFGEFEVNGFALFESVLGAAGPKYTKIAEFGAQ